MFGPHLRESVIVIFFWNIVVIGEDILEQYRPTPDFPKELNDWLTIVQQHKDDFRLIRDAAENFKKDEPQFNEELKEKINFKRDYNHLHLDEIDSQEEEESSLNDIPTHDIYPYMYQKKNNNNNRLKAGVRETQKGTQKVHSDRNHFSARLRRDSGNPKHQEKRHNIQVKYQSKIGEIERNDDKYPERYKNNMNSDLNKREIQIDVMNNGKLIKQIKDDSVDAKSFVLNVQAVANNSTPFMNKDIMVNQDNKIENNATVIHPGPPPRSLETDNKEEASNNFKNLFSANEHLITDRNEKNPIVYHITLPDINSFLHMTTTEAEINPQNDINRNKFYRNGLQDMSRYWTATEKQIMQKGIDFAQKYSSRRPDLKSNIDNDGFERVQGLVIEDGENNPRTETYRVEVVDQGKYGNLRPDDKRQLEINNQRAAEIPKIMSETKGFKQGISSNRGSVVVLENYNSKDKINNFRDIVPEDQGQLVPIEIDYSNKQLEPRHEISNIKNFNENNAQMTPVVIKFDNDIPNENNEMIIKTNNEYTETFDYAPYKLDTKKQSDDVGSNLENFGQRNAPHIFSSNTDFKASEIKFKDDEIDPTSIDLHSINLNAQDIKKRHLQLLTGGNLKTFKKATNSKRQDFNAYKRQLELPRNNVYNDISDPLTVEKFDVSANENINKILPLKSEEVLDPNIPIIPIFPVTPSEAKELESLGITSLSEDDFSAAHAAEDHLQSEEKSVNILTDGNGSEDNLNAAEASISKNINEEHIPHHNEQNHENNSKRNNKDDAILIIVKPNDENEVELEDTEKNSGEVHTNDSEEKKIEEEEETKPHSQEILNDVHHENTAEEEIEKQEKAENTNEEPEENHKELINEQDKSDQEEVPKDELQENVDIFIGNNEHHEQNVDHINPKEEEKEEELKDKNEETENILHHKPPKVQQIKSKIEEHKIVTKIETVTVIDNNDEIIEDDRKLYQVKKSVTPFSNNEGKHVYHKSIKVIAKPTRRHKQRQKFYIRDKNKKHFLNHPLHIKVKNARHKHDYIHRRSHKKHRDVNSNSEVSTSTLGDNNTPGTSQTILDNQAPNQIKTKESPTPQPNQVEENQAQKSQIQGNQVQRSNAQGNQIQGNNVQGNQVQGNQVQESQVQGNQVQESQVQGNQAQGNQVQGNQVQGNQLQESQVQGNQVQGNQVRVNQVQANKVQESQVQGNQVQKNQIQEKQLQENKIQEHQPQENQLTGNQFPEKHVEDNQLEENLSQESQRSLSDQTQRIQINENQIQRTRGPQIPGKQIQEYRIQGNQFQGNQFQGNQFQENQFQGNQAKHNHVSQQVKPRKVYAIKRNYYNNAHNFVNNQEPPTQYLDSIPAFIKRQLKASDYIYDVNLGYPDIKDMLGDEIDQESYNMKRRVTSEKSNLHKDSVEGDYGDEEDSATEKKQNNFKIVKKTQNEFANPVITTEEQDYYDDNYDNISNPSSESKKKTEKPQEKEESDKIPFGRRLHKKLKPQAKSKDKPIKVIEQSKKKKEKKKGESKQGDKRISLNFPSQAMFENSEFQQWPRFVRNDQENEEVLRKRSLAIKKKHPKRNNFPLSTKNFFLAPPKKDEKIIESKREKIFNRAALITEDDKGAVVSDKPVGIEDVSLPIDEKSIKLETNLNIKGEGLLNNSMDSSFGNLGNQDSYSNKMTTGGQGQNTSDSTELDECTQPPKVTITNACEDNEHLFNQTELVMTTVLPIIPDIESFTANSYEAFEKVDDLLTGKIPFMLVDDIFKNVKANKNFKEKFHKGLKRTHKPEYFKNIRENSEEESNKIINQMSELINKLSITTNCETLPQKLRHYLRLITGVEKETVLARAREMEGKDLDENQNQGTSKTFIFDSAARTDNLAEKVQVLKGLLRRFHSLPEQCKPRALPVKEYIENHLGMLNNMLSGEDSKSLSASDNSNANSEHEEHKQVVEIRSNFDNSDRNNRNEEDDGEKNLIEKQLDSLGLGKNKKFKPKFDLDDMIKNSRQRKRNYQDSDEANLESDKKQVKRSSSDNGLSEKYHKLKAAVERQKRKNLRVQRLAQMYGKLDDEDFGYNDKTKREAKGSFEAPLVYSF